MRKAAMTMAKAWKIVISIALTLLALGVVVGAVGFVTGASPDRMVETLFGGVEQMRDAFSRVLNDIMGIFNF